MATFIWPSNTRRVTSKFRTASRPNHNGVDIAESGTRPIYAIAAGEVTRSYYSTSYGECIMIKHSINGQTWESVYAHMRSGSRKVRVGQRVNKGQTIGTMGNTGRSSGQHLHFELHKGRWNINKSNAVDPLKYLEKDLSPKKATTSKNTSSTKANLTVDGKWGNETTKALQRALGTVVDGYISDQTKNSVTTAFYGDTIKFGSGKKGSLVVKALQKKVGSKQDGLLGPNTIRSLQRYLGTVADGKLSRPSLVVKELQKRINNGTF